MEPSLINSHNRAVLNTTVQIKNSQHGNYWWFLQLNKGSLCNFILAKTARVDEIQQPAAEFYVRAVQLHDDDIYLYCEQFGV